MIILIFVQSELHDFSLTVMHFHVFMFSVNVHASRMTGKLKEMPVREQNTAEEKEKRRKESALRDKAKPAQKETTMKRGKENACGLREHQKVHQINSLDKYRPECKNTWDEFQIWTQIYEYLMMWMFTRIRFSPNTATFIHTRWKLMVQFSQKLKLADYSPSPSGHPRLGWVCFIFRFGEMYHSISCSATDALQWMGAVRMRVQTADKNITIIHK